MNPSKGVKLKLNLTLNVNFGSLQVDFRFYLRGRLTHSGLAVLWNPYTGDLRRKGFSPFCLLLILTFSCLLKLLIKKKTKVPLPLLEKEHQASELDSAVYPGRNPAPPVSCYAFIIGWLLPSPPPGILRERTTLVSPLARFTVLSCG